MESKMKRVPTASTSSLPIFLLPGSIEIHLVSLGNIDGYRAVLFRLTSALASFGFPPLFKPFSLGYFNDSSEDYPRFSYFELISPFNTSIICFIASMLLLFSYFEVTGTRQSQQIENRNREIQNSVSINADQVRPHAFKQNHRK
ncbi:hypothetical protein YC2023_084544 [Brassica napus]